MSAKTFSFPSINSYWNIFLYLRNLALNYSKQFLPVRQRAICQNHQGVAEVKVGQQGSAARCCILAGGSQWLRNCSKQTGILAPGEQVESINLFGPTCDFSFLLLSQPSRQCSLPLLPRGTHEWQLTSHARRIPSGGSYSPSCFQLLGLPLQILQHHPGWQLLCYHRLVVFWFCGR